MCVAEELNPSESRTSRRVQVHFLEPLLQIYDYSEQTS